MSSESAGTITPPNTGAVTFLQAFAEELFEVMNARPRTDGAADKPPTRIAADKVIAAAHEAKLFGLAFSGGGIRSAIFNLGVLQALAKLQLLQRVDYLSTVSGGGYIGGWLSAWIARAGRTEGGTVNSGVGMDTVVKRLYEDKPASRLSAADPLEHLRRFSNYLTPKTGFFSADLWTGVATHVRNTLLNQTVLVPALLLILVLPWCLASATALVGSGGYPMARMLWAAGITLLVPTLLTGLNLAAADSRPDTKSPWWLYETPIALSMFLLVVASYCLTIWLWRAPLPEPGCLKWAGPKTVWALLGAIAYVVIVGVCSIGVLLGRSSTAPKRAFSIARLLITAVLAGAAGGLLMYAVQPAMESEWVGGHAWMVAGPGTVAVLAVLSLTVGLHTGLMSRNFSESVREWLARAGAWLFIFGLAWMSLFLLTFLAPATLQAGYHLLVAAGGVGWLASTIAGIVFGKGEKTGTPGKTTVQEVVTRAAPYIFIVGLLGLMAYGLYATLQAAHPTDNASGAVYEAYCTNGSFAYCLLAESELVGMLPWPETIFLIGLCVLIIGVMSRCVDVNVFSYHGYYRNRIARCFLGASHAKRRPNPFTGFDESDNIRMTGLPRRPFHIVNTTLNLTRTENLAWQERKAASFSITPLYCGYEMADAEGNPVPGYLKTGDHRQPLGLHLATAVAISGAAASPNMGYHSSAAVAFLLTLFNIRLGWWMPNTRYPTVWWKGGPRWGYPYLIRELFGAVGEKSNFVYLSDGGHFENMGLYELVRRRCRYIIVCDAEADSGYEFEGIASAIEKCRVDFGIRISLDVEAIKPRPGERYGAVHCAVGTIQYDAQDRNAKPGYLLYLKSSLVGNEQLPVDVKHYAYVHEDFPHQSTADQWFDESQFESYRQLGYKIAMASLEGSLPKIEGSENPLMEALFTTLAGKWVAAHPVSPVTGDRASFTV